jgi:hypothetical protein
MVKFFVFMSSTIEVLMSSIAIIALSLTTSSKVIFENFEVVSAIGENFR